MTSCVILYIVQLFYTMFVQFKKWLTPKLQTEIFYDYRDIATLRVDNIADPNFADQNLNGHNFLLADGNDLNFGARMNIHKKLQKIPQYSISKIHNGSY